MRRPEISDKYKAFMAQRCLGCEGEDRFHLPGVLCVFEVVPDVKRHVVCSSSVAHNSTKQVDLSFLRPCRLSHFTIPGRIPAQIFLESVLTVFAYLPPPFLGAKSGPIPKYYLCRAQPAVPA